MRLLIERSQRRDWLGRRWYQLAITAETNVVEREIFETHALWDVDVYVSPVFVAQEQAAVGCFEASQETEGWGNAVAWRRLRLDREGLAARRASHLESHITVRHLVAGSMHEARDIGELLSLEGGVRTGFDALRQRLEILARYDAGDVLVVNDDTADAGVGPTKWITMR